MKYFKLVDLPILVELFLLARRSTSSLVIQWRAERSGGRHTFLHTRLSPTLVQWRASRIERHAAKPAHTPTRELCRTLPRGGRFSPLFCPATPSAAADVREAPLACATRGRRGLVLRYHWRPGT